MTVTIAWCVIASLLSAIFIKRPLIIAGMVIMSYAAVPLAASNVTFFASPGDYFLVIFSLIFFLFRQPKNFFAEYKLLTVFVSFISIFMMICRIMGGGGIPSTVLLTSKIIVFPYIFFMIIRYCIIKKIDNVRSFAVPVLLIVVIELGISYYQNLTGEILVWESIIRSQWWVQEDFEVTQPLGTFGHWIPLSVFLALSLAVIYFIKSRTIFYLISGLSFFILTLSAARSGIFAFGAIFVVLILTEIFSGSAKDKLYAILVVPILALCGIWIFTGSAGEIFRNKLIDDNNSTSLRLRAISWFWSSTDEFMLSGRAQGSNLREEGVLTTSLENAFYIFALTFGFISMVLLMLLIFSLILAASRKARKLFLATVVVGASFVFTLFTNGAFSVGEFTSLMLFWSLMAIYSSQKESNNLQTIPSNDSDDYSKAIGFKLQPES